MELNRQYIVDENNHKIAVQMDIKTFEKIEEILENYALYRLMIEDRSFHALTWECKSLPKSKKIDMNTISIEVDNEVASSFSQASNDEKRKFQFLLNLRLKELMNNSNRSLLEVIDDIGNYSD